MGTHSVLFYLNRFWRSLQRWAKLERVQVPWDVVIASLTGYVPDAVRDLSTPKRKPVHHVLILLLVFGSMVGLPKPFDAGQLGLAAKGILVIFLGDSRMV